MMLLSLDEPDIVCIAANGPAIWGGCVTRRQHRAESRYFSQKVVTVQGGYGTCFCRHGTNFIAFWRDRGTSLIRTGKLSQYRIFDGGTGAVLSRRSGAESGVAVQYWSKAENCQDLLYFNCEQVRVSGCSSISDLSWEQGQKQKPWQTTYPYCPCYRLPYLLFYLLVTEII